MILSIILVAWEMSAIDWCIEHSLVLPFLGIGMKIDRFWSCGHCWVFQICWHNECGTLIAYSFRILNSSAGIPTPPLALWAAVLPKAHLTSHSRTSGSEWETAPSWLSGSHSYLALVLSSFPQLFKVEKHLHIQHLVSPRKPELRQPRGPSSLACPHCSVAQWGVKCFSCQLSMWCSRSPGQDGTLFCKHLSVMNLSSYFT